MEMKIRARLSAYSKVDSMSGLGVPAATEKDAGAVLAVDANGNYSLVSSVSNSQVDDLFNEDIFPTIVDKDTIDSLFETVESDRPVSKDEIDDLFGEVNNSGNSIGTVTHSAIDSLFK